MTTVSVPLTAKLCAALDQLVRDKVAPNKAEAMRQALRWYLEDLAVQTVLRAEKEQTLTGNLEVLAKQ